LGGYLSKPISAKSASILIRLWVQIRRFRPQILVYLTKPRGDKVVLRHQWFFRTCGIRRIIGLPLADRAVNLKLGPGVWESEAARLARSVNELGTIDLNDPAAWNLRLTAEEHSRAEMALEPARGRPLIACGPGTKMQSKDWGTANWSALMAKLSKELPDHTLVLVGAREEREQSEHIGAAWLGHVINLCGEPLREIAAVLHHAELFLGCDSGLMHLAAAAGVPCVIAFAARTKPGIWFPQGSGHRVLYRTVDCAGCNLEICIEQKKKCLTSITVDDMLAASLDAWREKRKPRELTLAPKTED